MAKYSEVTSNDQAREFVERMMTSLSDVAPAIYIATGTRDAALAEYRRTARAIGTGTEDALIHLGAGLIVNAANQVISQLR